MERQVSASTQNQAKSALLYLYRQVLEIDLPWLDEVVQARRPKRLPMMLTSPEVRGIPAAHEWHAGFSPLDALQAG